MGRCRHGRWDIEAYYDPDPEAPGKRYTTASGPKRAYLHSLSVQHVFHSRSTWFEKINRMTDGAGLDVVLNSLTSETFIEATLSVLSAGGRFVEIGNRGIWMPEQMR